MMPNAMIWGASGGIGSALAKQLKQEGWTVYGAARNTKIIPIEVDEKYYFDASEPATFIETSILLAQDAQTLDLVVYAAGGMRADKMESFGADTWKQVMDANLNGAYLGIQSILHLVPKDGHVMVIGAYVEKIMLPKFGAYTTAKAALTPMMTIFAKENRRKNFTLVNPPAVNTPFWANVPFTLPETALTAEQVAAAIMAQYHTGKNGTLNM